MDLANSDSATVFEISSTEYLKLKPSSVRKPGQTPLLLSLADLHKEDVVHVGIWRCLINSAWTPDARILVLSTPFMI